MPLLFFSGAVLAAIAKWIVAALGVGLVVFVGLGSLLDQVTTYVQTSFGQLPTTALQVAGLLKLDVALNIVLSAYGINLSMMALRVFRRA